MAESNNNPLMYLRLQIAYALEFAVWGGWSYALGEFCGNYGLKGGVLYSAFALGALFSPVVGPIADRGFAAQKVFALMQGVCGVALLACHNIVSHVAELGGYSELHTPSSAWIALMFVAGLMFMPSIPLLNTIVFKHIPDSKKSPFVFIFGTIGWIVVNWIIAKTPLEKFYLIDGGVAIALAVYALTLPNTPPSGSTNKDPFGFKALALFKRFDFTLFIICATVVGIYGSNYYFPFVGECFPNKGVYNQYSEIIFMAALSFAVARIGLKWTLTLGMGAWGVRYLLFATGSDKAALIGILCHGLAYAFLYTAAYMYADRVAPKELKTSVQALVAFLLLGVAQVLSGLEVDRMKNNNVLEPAAETAAVSVFNSVAYAQDGSIADAAANVADKALDAAADAGNAVADAAGEALDAAADAASNVADAAADAGNAVADAAGDALDAAANVASEATDAVVDAGNAVADAAGDALDSAANVASDAADAVVDAGNAVADAVSGAIDATTEAVTDAVEATADAASDAVEKGKKFSVWDKSVWDKYNWKKIWGGPAFVCLVFALIFAILGKEPKASEEETESEKK